MYVSSNAIVDCVLFTMAMAVAGVILAEAVDLVFGLVSKALKTTASCLKEN